MIPLDFYGKDPEKLGETVGLLHNSKFLVRYSIFSSVNNLKILKVTLMGLLPYL